MSERLDIFVLLSNLLRFQFYQLRLGLNLNQQGGNFCPKRPDFLLFVKKPSVHVIFFTHRHTHLMLNVTELQSLSV